jgi:hypothetical protein
MGILRRAAPVALVLAVVSVVTAILWNIRVSVVGPQHLVFFLSAADRLSRDPLRQPPRHAVRDRGYALRGIFPLRPAL